MPRAGVVVTGVEELDAKLATMEPKLGKKLSRQAMDKACKQIVLPAILANISEETSDESGKLSNPGSWQVRAVRAKRGRYGRQVQIKPGVFDSDNFYPMALEFGTKPRFTKAGAYTGQIERTGGPYGNASQFSYMRRGLYENERPIRALYIGSVQQFVREL